MEHLRDRNAQSDEPLSRKHDFIRSFHEAMFSVNIVSAFGYALLVYISKNQRVFPPQSDLGYYLLRSAVRVNDLLGFGSMPSVSTSAGGRGEYAVHQIGLEVTLVVTIACLGVLIFLLLRLCAGTSAHRMIMSRVSGITALFALPACLLCASGLTWKWKTIPEEAHSSSFWQSPLLSIFAAEVVTLGILLVYRKRPFALWIPMALLILHYGFWVLVLWPGNPISVSWVSIYTLYTPYILLSVFFLSGIAWLLYLKARCPNVVNPRDHGKADKWTLVTVALCVAVLLIIWLPGRKHSLAGHRDLKSLAIQLSRGPCRGSCPQYTITIHGDGLVEYDGSEYVGAKGHQVKTASYGQLMQILQSLDYADFTRLEDRAFDYCFDSSSVAVSVSMDGRTKRVVSDGHCASPGPQARFIQTAREIDIAVGSSEWVMCQRHPCYR